MSASRSTVSAGHAVRFAGASIAMATSLVLVAATAGLLRGARIAAQPSVRATQDGDITYQWKPVASMHHSRLRHTMVDLADGRVLVAAGTVISDDGQEVRGSGLAELYAEGSGWTSIPDMPLIDDDSPQYATGVVLPDGDVVIGDGQEGRKHGVGVLLHVLHTATVEWSNVLVPRSALRTAMDIRADLVAFEGGLLLVGGLVATIPDHSLVTSSREVCIVDMNNQDCSRKYQLQVDSGNSLALMIGPNELLVAGGGRIVQDDLTTKLVESFRTEQLDLESGVTTRLADMAISPLSPEGGALPDGSIIVVGDSIADAHQSVAIFDPQRNVWTREGFGSPLYWPRLVIASDGTPFVYSSDADHCCYLRDNRTGRWFEVNKPPEMTSMGAAVALRSGGILVTGVGDVNAAILTNWSFPTSLATITPPATVSPVPGLCATCTPVWLPIGER